METEGYDINGKDEMYLGHIYSAFGAECVYEAYVNETMKDLQLSEKRKNI